MHRSYDGVSVAEVPTRPLVRREAVTVEQESPIASKELLKGQRQVWIDHGGTLYCLKATSNGRLYLTK
ncbi:hemin uptake protein HemP [Bremerella cremea]|uniref:hemin uptake protein HemP n=1 Tax=Bremerella cremea TaxID=1031537 RepID=UPI0031EEA21C